MSFIDIATMSLVSRIFKAVLKGTIKIKIIFFISLTLLVTALVITIAIDSELIDRRLEIIAIILGGIGGMGMLSLYGYQTNLEETEAKEKLIVVEKNAREHPNEPTVAWELARIKLESYLNRNLTQIQWIFIWTVLVMVAGFSIISYGIVKAFDTPANLNASLITAGSGVIIEFIGATFLTVYRSSMQQAKEYVDVLERINAVGMSVQILETISDNENKLQDITRADIAKLLLTMYKDKGKTDMAKR